jgi:RNA polymerase sigma-70 factor (ECF subfamily)
MAQAAQAGCLSSFEELVRRYEGRIYRFVSHHCWNASDAQELTQDVFVAAHRGITRFDPSRSFATWLFTIARHKCIDYSRARRTVLSEGLPEPTDENDPGAMLVRREAGEDLWCVARAALSELQYDALWLRYAEDMEVADIARVMKRTRTHVKVLLFRARLRLERELKGERIDLTVRSEPGDARQFVSAASSQIFRVASGGGM